MKIISWNVNGIRAAWNHGLSAFIADSNADIYAFQETKTNERIRQLEVDGYFPYWSFCERKKGYSGTLILTKYKPRNVRFDIGDKNFDTEGRIITLEYDKFYLVNCYVPNSQRSKERYDYRTAWDELLFSYLTNLQNKKPVIVCGDFNVPISDDDIYEKSKWVEWNAEGFQSTERENLLRLTKAGFVDSYRLLYPDERGKYTWWSNRLFKRDENHGWRLDYFFISQKLIHLLDDSIILTDVLGSDHCPIQLEIEIPEIHKAKQKEVVKNQIKYEDLISAGRKGFDKEIQKADMTFLWNSIDWTTAESRLADMQCSLAKAAYNRNMDSVTKLQMKIVCSLDAKVLAVRHVCGAARVGIDLVKWVTPEEKMTAALSLTSKDYRAMPSRLLLINSKDGKERRIHIETYYDRAMQTLYAYSLDPIAESWGDRKSFAFRKGRSQYDIHEYIKTAFSGDNAPEWAFIADVRKCYENISHDWILKNIPLASGVLKEFLNAGYIFAGNKYEMNVGVGIGCAISPIIANMVLDGLQAYVFDRLYDGKEIDYANGNLVRYADDIIIAARDEETAQAIRGYVRDFLAERGLNLSNEKSHIVNINDEFTFMSRTYKKRGVELFAEPSEESIERFMKTLRETIENYTGSQKSLIEKLNKKIDGWVTYHKISEADTAFRQIDVYISALLLELCEKKHPKWKRDKIIKKYWYRDSKGRYRYALEDKREVSVKFLADALLIDYIPVKTNLNPYIDTEYLEKRSKEKQILSVTGIYRYIWNRQNGKCHYCGHPILRDDEKTLVEINAAGRSEVARMAYVHCRCLDNSVDFVDSESSPASLTDIMTLLENLNEGKRTLSMRYAELSDFFKKCNDNSVTLTFQQIEEIMGAPLGKTALREEFWYRTGFSNISQCWLDNGYEIKRLHLKDRRRVVFHLTSESKNTAALKIPAVLKDNRIPVEAKYELENYFKYIIKKYGL